jgi:NAD-dependent DNA ligase
VTTEKAEENMMEKRTAEIVVGLLKFLDTRYANGRPLISDQVYNAFHGVMKKQIGSHPYFDKVGAPLKAKGRIEVKLPIPMGSLGKLRPNVAIDWIKKLPRHVEMVATPKLDGLALLAEYIYERDSKYFKLAHVYTRGEDGVTGFDVTDNAIHIHGMQRRIKFKNKLHGMPIDRIYVGGEAVIHKGIFAKKYYKKSLEPKGRKYKNARNFSIGMINRLNLRDIHKRALNDMTFITYGMDLYRGKATIGIRKSEALNYLAACKFITVLAPRRADHRVNDFLHSFWLPKPATLTADRLNFMLKDWRSKFDLLQDGIVLDVDQPEIRQSLGSKNGRPAYAYAIKPEVADQTSLNGVVDRVAMDISKAGIYYPVWHLRRPLNFDGVDVRRISASNADLLAKSKAGPGAVIKVIRSGDVIPFYAETVKPAPLELPTRCTYCNTKLRWTINKQKERTHLYCPNTSCPGPHQRIMEHFFKVLKVEGLKKGVIKSMVVAGLDTIPKILSATPQQLRRVEGFGDRKTQKIIEGLRAIVRDVSLPELMHASSLFSDEMIGVGVRRLTPIVAKLGRNKILNGRIDQHAMRVDLLDIPGIGPEIVDRFMEGLILFREFYRDIMNIVTIAKERRGKLTGKVFVFTNFRDGKMEEAIKKHGGIITDNISRNTSVLYAASDTTGKAIDAAERGIKTVTKEKAWEHLKQMIGT